MRALAREAAATLADALDLSRGRDRHRQQLAAAIEQARRARDAADAAGDTRARDRAAVTLVKAYAARARDACHGAGQLSRGSQRAPTRDDCDDGWQRVAEIVANAETAAIDATRAASALEDAASARPAAKASAAKAAVAARAAASDARRIVDERNHAYTFHADPSFSFGEGWYLAAASLLGGVAIQIEPDKQQTTQAERFLRDAGLAAHLAPFRPRPRSNKQLTEIVASAFRADPAAAQQRLRAAFLGRAEVRPAIAAWIDRALAGAPAASDAKKVLLWVRHCGQHDPGRNTDHAELGELARRARDAGLVPVLFGDAVPDDERVEAAADLTLCWKLPPFQGPDMRRAQLWLFEHLVRAHGLVGQLGVTTAGMDGPALMGLETMYLTHEPNVRMGLWVGAIPGYQEIVRDEAYLERVDATLRRWARGRAPG